MTKASQPKHSAAALRRKGAVYSFGCRTDIGCVREHNEDSLVAAPPLFVVADGMGGHAAGEVASEIAVQTIVEQAGDSIDCQRLREAVKAANSEIIRAAEEGRGKNGMGTTVTAAQLQGDRLVLAQVGDSRAYLLHEGVLSQLTRDHSLVAEMVEAGTLSPQEARVHPQRSVITRALGSDPYLEPDMYEINVEAGDRLLLCSDGLSGMLDDEALTRVLTNTRDAQRAATQLVNESIAAGGHDNVTVIVVDVPGFAEKQTARIRVKTKLFVALSVLLAVAVLAGAAYAGKTYVENSAFLIDENGKVAIYQGLPGDIAGISLSSLVRVSDVSVDDLPPGVANRLAEGIRVDSLAQAEALVLAYEQDIAGENESAAGAEALETSDESAAGAEALETSDASAVEAKSDDTSADSSESTATDGAGKAVQ